MRGALTGQAAIKDRPGRFAPPRHDQTGGLPRGRVRRRATAGTASGP